MIANIISKVGLDALDELELNQMEYDLSRAAGRVQNKAVASALTDLMNHVSFAIDGASGDYVPEYRLKAAPDFEYVNKLDFSGLSADEVATAVAAIDRALVLVAGDRVVTRGLTALKGVLVSSTGTVAETPVETPVEVPVVVAVADEPSPGPMPIPVIEPKPQPQPFPNPDPSPTVSVSVAADSASAAPAVTGASSLDDYLAKAITRLRKGRVHGTINISISLDF